MGTNNLLSKLKQLDTKKLARKYKASKYIPVLSTPYYLIFGRKKDKQKYGPAIVGIKTTMHVAYGTLAKIILFGYIPFVISTGEPNPVKYVKDKIENIQKKENLESKTKDF